MFFIYISIIILVFHLYCILSIITIATISDIHTITTIENKVVIIFKHFFLFLLIFLHRNIFLWFFLSMKYQNFSNIEIFLHWFFMHTNILLNKKCKYVFKTI
ncbi:hypothetical protein EDEG_02765 [Edhazardia aedis USNM 41457]|uniref:Uncharacterized protein n=1 Tax=Edhazardia aedis (strain USNM 41457) TaxID=1003232 RepID=J9D5K5_EDHAE|nr:hypothetical protein EDEG_02765 [Edhazardia aedis USNM 41457]|eukprot:EJW02824.1 hypothetical protein EDEG_02765 [Edhazardia aedis USNM 41457]